ncbi:phage portal protein [Streptomyces sp. 6N106]|uniref:phage portal protein n=1 Tax=Streptomyces sp. 6N106 TaxID=3457418 RepID=UPI003FD48198
MNQMIQEGLSGFASDRERLDRVDRYIRGEHDGPYTPPSASTEYKLLAQRAVSNWMPLLVKTPAQAMAVSGYRRAGVPDGETSPEWKAWQANRMDSRQTAVHRGGLGSGLAYVTVQRDALGQPKARGVSARQLFAWYADPASDALPVWALEMPRRPDANNAKDVAKGWLYTATSVAEVLVSGGKDATITVVSTTAHGITLNGVPVCPVVRFAPDIDLEGRVTGVVEPMIPIQDRVNQTVFDLLVAQTFGSFKVRTVAGMAPEFQRDPETGEILYDENGRAKPIPIRADASRFLVAPDADTKFAQLDETPLGGFLDAIEAGVKHLAAVSQTPPHYLLGSLVNLSAEALAAAEAALTRAVTEYQHAMGESWELVLALFGSILGQPYDPEAQVTWADFESRSLAQTVDALGKAVQMLQVPARAMWSRIPGVTDKDVEEWAQIAEEDNSEARLANAVTKAMAPAPEEPANAA